MSMSSNTTTTSSSDTTTLTGIECNYAATTCTAEISTSDTAECCCGFPRDDNTSSVTHLDDSEGEGTGFVAFDATTLAKIESSATFSPSVPVCGIPVVTLIVHYKTTPGESIRVASSSPAFGAWCQENALLMTWTDNHVGFFLSLLVILSDFEYKYIKMEVCSYPFAS
ncbi:hypothetical protein Pelo_19509 [Pelomyxa schiedti]|nr:hypothetical protein Pelo_19509 [Pelomyxa schiedti]